MLPTALLSIEHPVLRLVEAAVLALVPALRRPFTPQGLLLPLLARPSATTPIARPALLPIPDSAHNASRATTCEAVCVRPTNA